LKRRDSTGTIYYYNNAKQIHREDGPAVKNKVIEEWWINDKRHRENDEPAVLQYTIYRKNKAKKLLKIFVCHIEMNKVGVYEQEWWYNGKLHRIGGPAIIRYNEITDTFKKEYYINGQRYDTTEYFIKLQELY